VICSYQYCVQDNTSFGAILKCCHQTTTTVHCPLSTVHCPLSDLHTTTTLRHYIPVFLSHLRQWTNIIIELLPFLLCHLKTRVSNLVPVTGSTHVFKLQILSYLSVSGLKFMVLQILGVAPRMKIHYLDTSVDNCSAT
jgi:hypothetical protein